MLRGIFLVLVAGGLAACGRTGTPSQTAEGASQASIEIIGVDDVAERFVRLGLALGEHDPDYVDAYHGPREWAEAAKADRIPLVQLNAEAARLAEALSVLSSDGIDLRERMLGRLVSSAHARIRMVQGETYSFDDETLALYDAVAPAYDVAEFDAALQAIDDLLPGEGELSVRVDAFRASLSIPADSRKAVFDAAIAACRDRTLVHVSLPENETFRLEFVTGKPWNGYNWYKGNFESLIEINVDLPIGIDRAVDLGCHEGYPGHHFWNSLIEREIVQGEGWVEYTLYPLFSPLSLIAEGSANFGIELAFPGEEKTNFERDVLFPLAGLDPSQAPKLAELNRLQRRLSHARNLIARDYLDGRITKSEAVALLTKYGLTSKERAEKSLSFVERYRGYVINYNLGRDIVAAKIAREVSGGVDPWVAFLALLSSPATASDLIR